MATRRLDTLTLAASLLLTVGACDAAAATITITATVSDRGIDVFPWDGMSASVFGNPSVIQITTPPIGTLMASEERSGVEFPLVMTIPTGSVIDSVTLRLSPLSQNIGLGAGEAGAVHGYAGDGVIDPEDLNDSTLVASLVGPTPDGPLTVTLPASWFQSVVDAGSPFAGLMFKGVPGSTAVTYNFEAAFSGVPVDDRPTLTVEYHADETPAIPEPGTMTLLGSALALAAIRRRPVRVPLIWRACPTRPERPGRTDEAVAVCDALSLTTTDHSTMAMSTMRFGIETPDGALANQR